MKEIPLTRGCVALVDDKDFEFLSRFKWHAVPIGNTIYARRCTGDREYGNRKDFFLHREIMQPPNGMVIDHIDGDGLNNARANLRVCTRAQNQINKHQAPANRFYGVTFSKAAQKWMAQLRANKRHYYLGVFETDEEAARARDAAALKYQGEFARLNFPDGAISSFMQTRERT